MRRAFGFGAFSMAVPCRCWRCWARRTLKKAPKLCNRPPRCFTCGKPSMFVCKDRITRGKKQACNCSGYHFKHRKGSKYCEHHPNYEKHWTERMES